MPVIPPLPLTDWEAIEGQQATDAPPLPVRPEPLVWFVITSRDNIIESIEGPTTATDAKAMQTKTVESNYGEVAAVIVHKSVASRIRINGSVLSPPRTSPSRSEQPSGRLLCRGRAQRV